MKYYKKKYWSAFTIVDILRTSHLIESEDYELKSLEWKSLKPKEYEKLKVLRKQKMEVKR